MTYLAVEEEHKELLLNSNFVTMDYTKKKPPIELGGLRKKPDLAKSDIVTNDTHNIADKPNLYKQNDRPMSENSFIKLIRSETTEWLMENHPNAFLLLTQITLRARRYEGHIDGKSIGQAEIGDYWKAGIESEQKYRTAKNVLIKLKIIEICHTKRMKNNFRQRPKSEQNVQKCKNATTNITTKNQSNGTVVKILSSSVYDININVEKKQDNDHNNDRATTDQRPHNDKQEDKESEKNHPHDVPSFFQSSNLMNDDFSKKIKIFDGCEMSENDYSKCLELKKGNREDLIKHATFIFKNPSRKSEIKNWPNALAKWKMPNEVLDKSKENGEYVKRLENEYCDKSHWKLRYYNDSIKDQKGILFECQGAAGGHIFFALTDPDLKNKIESTIKAKKIPKKKKINGG